MAEMIKVKPKNKGAIIRFPGNPAQILPEDGGMVAKDRFWTRRIDGGDVIVVETNTALGTDKTDKIEETENKNKQNSGGKK